MAVAKQPIVEDTQLVAAAPLPGLCKTFNLPETL